MLLALLGLPHAVRGQQRVTSEAADEPGPEAGGPVAASSTEQGQTPLTDGFELDRREWRLKARKSALEDTQFKFNFRTYYLNRHKFDGSESEAWAVGGWAGIKTGYFLEHVAFGVTGYTSQNLYGPDDKDGTLLLAPGQDGYSVLGEAYVDVRIVDDLNLYVGRKEFDSPYINRNDSRMTPNTFELAVLQGRIKLGGGDDVPAPAPAPVMGKGPDSSKGADPSKDSPAPVLGPKQVVPVIKYGLGYFHTIKERNSEDFVSMSEDAGASAERGVFAAGAVYEKGDFSIGGIDYYSPDIINIAYAELKWGVPVTATWRPKVALQFTDQRSVGDDLLQGDGFSAQQAGIKADLPAGRALFSAGYTHTADGTNMQSPWSGYPGYTSVQVQDFNRSGEGAVLLRAAYDFEQVKGLSAYALAVLGTEPSDAGQYRQNEYDLNLQWAPPEGVLKGLSARVRYALVHEFGANTDDLTDFRVILNYARTF